MAISDWPIQERPREKLLARGPASLSDAELLAIFLRTGVNGTNAVTLASQLLEAFSGLRGLLEASRQAFCAHRGLGEAKYAQLQAVLEMARRHLACELQRGIALENPELVRRFLQLQLRHEQREVFVALMLDSQHRVISCEELFSGTIDGAAVYPREVVKAALGQNAAAVIFAHNHPSGIAEPSQADKRITERLVEALALVDIRVLDHLIVGDQTTLSFAETGLMPGPY